MVPGFLQTWRLAFTPKEFSLRLIRPENSVSHGLRVLRELFRDLQMGFHVAEEWLPSALSTTRAWLIDCSRDARPSGGFWSSDRVTVGFLVTFPTEVLLSRTLRPAPGRLPAVPDFWNHYWDLGSSRNFSVSFHRFVPRDDPVSEILQAVPLSSCSVCALNVNSRESHGHVCVLPNNYQTNELTIGGLQLRCRNISRITSGNRMYLNS